MANYKLVNIYPNVRYFAAGNNQLYAIYGKKLFDLKQGILIKEFGENLHFLGFGNSKFWVHESSGTGYLLSNGELTEYSKTFFLHEIEKGEFLVSIDNKTKILQGNNIIEFCEITDSISIFCDNNFYLRKNPFVLRQEDSIAKQSLESKKLDWEFSLKELGPYEKLGEKTLVTISFFIGVYNDTLWCSLNSNQLIGIDVSSGKLKYHLTGVDKENAFGTLDKAGWDSEDQYCIWYGKYIIDQENGFLRGYYNERYYEMDLKCENPVIKVYGLIDQLKEHGITNFFSFHMKPAQWGNNFLFINHREKKLVVLDTLTKKIIFVSEPIYTKGTENCKLQEMQIHENKIYITDSLCYLYEFQIEN